MFAKRRYKKKNKAFYEPPPPPPEPPETRVIVEGKGIYTMSEYLRLKELGFFDPWYKKLFR